MTTIKESYKPWYKRGQISDGVWLEKALHRPDALGRRGIDVFKKEGIEVVHGNERADYGLSLHGEPVEGVPRNKCILFKGEPPIYNLYFGLRLCSPKYNAKFKGVLSNYIIDGINQVHFNSPQNQFQSVNKYFDRPKTEFLCMVLSNKKTSILLSGLVVGNWKYYKQSNHKIRILADNYFCDRFGPEKYHSYGRGWNPKCFKGGAGDFVGEKIELVDGEYHYTPPYHGELEVISKYKFNFCPENSRFEGYVTEKPIHAMVAGSIPIYLGSPHPDYYLPSDTFIDFGAFIIGFSKKPSLVALCHYLENMNDSEYQSYRKAMRRFLTSKEADNFSSYIFAQKLVRMLEE